MIRGELGLEELLYATKFTKNRFLRLRREHDKGHQTEHGDASKAILSSLHDVALTARMGLNHASLRGFCSHLVGRILLALGLAKLLLEAITCTIALRQHPATRIANRVAWQRSTAAIRASTHVIWLGWRRITIVQDNPLKF